MKIQFFYTFNEYILTYMHKNKFLPVRNVCSAALQLSNHKPVALIMKANLSPEKKSNRAPLTEGLLPTGFPLREAQCRHSPILRLLQTDLNLCQASLFCGPTLNLFQTFLVKEIQCERGGGGRERQCEKERKKNGGTEGKCRRDKHTSSLSSRKVVSSEQAVSAL